MPAAAAGAAARAAAAAEDGAQLDAEPTPAAAGGRLPAAPWWSGHAPGGHGWWGGSWDSSWVPCGMAQEGAADATSWAECTWQTALWTTPWTAPAAWRSHTWGSGHRSDVADGAAPTAASAAAEQELGRPAPPAVAAGAACAPLGHQHREGRQPGADIGEEGAAPATGTAAASPFTVCSGDSFVVRRTPEAGRGRGEGPSPADRAWLRGLRELAAAASSAGFGSPGALQPTKARRQLAFAEAAVAVWPDLGRLSSVSLGSLVPRKEAAVEQGWLSDEVARATPCVDPLCPLWRNGQAKYFGVLGRCLDALQACGTPEPMRRGLLADLGFHLVEDFLSEAEEVELLEYWSQEGPIYWQGADEQLTHRRFFHYGPILPKVQSNTTKSTLGVVPALLGHAVRRGEAALAAAHPAPRAGALRRVAGGGAERRRGPRRRGRAG